MDIGINVKMNNECERVYADHLAKTYNVPPKKPPFPFSAFIAFMTKWMLLKMTIYWFINSLIWAIKGDNEKWFTRTVLTVICFGFTAVVFAIGELNKKETKHNEQ